MRGPYVEVNGPTVYFPISDFDYSEARRQAAWHARDTLSGYGRSRYLGKRSVPLHDHDEPWDEDDDGCEPEPVYVFEVYE